MVTSRYLTLFYNTYCPITQRIFFVNYDHCNSFDDFVYEISTRLWEHRKNFRGEPNLVTYLLDIVKYWFNEKIRQSHKMVRMENKEGVTHFTLDSYDALSLTEVISHLMELKVSRKEAKDKLITKQQILELAHVTGIFLKEASQILGCSPDALRGRLKWARIRLRK